MPTFDKVFPQTYEEKLESGWYVVIQFDGESSLTQAAKQREHLHEFIRDFAEAAKMPTMWVHEETYRLARMLAGYTENGFRQIDARLRELYRVREEEKERQRQTYVDIFGTTNRYREMPYQTPHFDANTTPNGRFRGNRFARMYEDAAATFASLSSRGEQTPRIEIVRDENGRAYALRLRTDNAPDNDTNENV